MVVPFRLLLPPGHSRNRPAQPPPLLSYSLATGPPLVATVLHWHPVPAKNLGKRVGKAKTCWMGTEGLGGRDGIGRVTSLLHVSPCLILDFPGGQKPSSSCGSGNGGLTLARSGWPCWGISRGLCQPIRWPRAMVAVCGSGFLPHSPSTHPNPRQSISPSSLAPPRPQPPSHPTLPKILTKHFLYNKV
uniref:Uncharacterized protein n=1 Tax=Myotis myotis TaxID=51298 RepID=A0A7J7Y0J4_MYOMY|nr:hypothetical protein mMyoMyo1_011517 [Myotis myotis]